MDDLGRNSIDVMAEEFVSRIRRGEAPSIEEYAERAREHSQEIRELFPVLRVMERAAPHEHSLTAPVSPFGGEQAPAQVGDYRILREAGRGGMGVVYEAEQISLGRHVAIKILPDRAARDTKQLLRFRREARSAGRLHHTNIVPVFDVGSESGIHYYTMQFIQGNSMDVVIQELKRAFRQIRTHSNGDMPVRMAGQTGELSGRIARNFMTGTVTTATMESHLAEMDMSPRQADDSLDGSLPAPEFKSLSWDKCATQLFRNVAKVGMQVADALAYAHSQRVLHRDIKPSNLLLDVHGDVWVTDFGLAKYDDEYLTATGDVVGTLRYMAPETFKRSADARSDIYSLGLTLYELLTIRSGDDAQGIRRTGVSTKIPLPRTVDRGIPRDLETIVLKALAHEPEHRYSTADEMADDLRRYLADRPIRSRRTSWLEHAWMGCRRNPALAVTACVAAILLVFGCLGWGVSRMLREERDLALRAEQSARAHEYFARATSLIASGRPASRHRALREISEAMGLNPQGELRDELRDAAIAALAMTDIRSEVIRWDTILSDEGKNDRGKDKIPQAWTVAPHRNWIAMHFPAQETISVVDYKKRRTIAQFPVPQPDSILSFSPSGSLLIAVASKHGGYLSAWNVETEKRIFYCNEYFASDISPDEAWLAVGEKEKSIRLVNLRNPDESESVAVDGVPRLLAFSPDGKRLAVSFYSGDSTITLYDMASRTLERRLPTGYAASLSWFPDGKRLAAANSHVEIWDVENSRPLASTGETNSAIDCCRVLSDGDLLATGAWDGTTRFWDLRRMRELLKLETKVTLGQPSDEIVGWRSASGGIELISLDKSPILFPLAAQLGAGECVRASQFNAQGSMLVNVIGQGTRGNELQLMSLSDRRLLASISLDNLTSASFDEALRRLTIVHDDQLSVLPASWKEDSELELGPPQTCSLPWSPTESAISSNGQTIAAVDQRRMSVWQLTPQTENALHSPLELVIVMEVDLPYPHESICLSPDGLWATTHHWHSRVICIWDLTRKQLAREIKVDGNVIVRFSPDSSHVVISTSDAYRFVNLRSFQSDLTLPRRDCPLPSRFGMNPQGNFGVACLEMGELQCVDFRSGQVLGRLPAPNRSRGELIVVQTDGSLLVEASVQDGAHLWDLEALSAELKSRGFSLPIPAQMDTTTRTPVRAVKLVGMEDIDRTTFIGSMSESQAAERLEAWERKVKENPESALYVNNLAWNLCLAPPPLRNPQRAIEIAEEARQRSDSSTIRNTLAAAYFRNGDYEKAISLLQTNLPRSDDTDLPWDLLLISLCQSGLREWQHAETYLELAQRWMHTNGDEFRGMSRSEQDTFAALLQEAKAALASKGTADDPSETVP
jgi:eukaryotic-like serine/threonine-protein kinase